MKEMDKLEDIKDNFPYKDILYLEHPTSKNHPRQPSLNRAGQFSPFAALTGYEDEIKEASRLTKEQIFLDEEEKRKLDEKMSLIMKKQELIEVEIEYFIKDQKKTGGSYNLKKGIIKRIDTYNKKIIFEDKERINIDDIVNIKILNEQETE